MGHTEMAAPDPLATGPIMLKIRHRTEPITMTDQPHISTVKPSMLPACSTVYW